MFGPILEGLRGKHVFVSDEWLAYTLSTFTSNNVNVNHIYRKLLNCDLKMVKMDDSHALPIDLFDQTLTHKSEWQGTRVMQLISVCVSNAPRVVNDNDFLELPEENSDDEYSQTERKAAAERERLSKVKVKGPRLLSLIITDGTHEFKAIEYKPIECLNEKLPFGTKLLLKGTVEIQMGIMFLRSENIEVLGGIVSESNGVVNGANATNGNDECILLQ